MMPRLLYASASCGCSSIVLLILERCLGIASSERCDAPLVISESVLWVQGDGLIQIFIGLLHMAELGVRQPAMLIGSGIAGRRLDGLRICGNSFRIALCEE